MEKPQTCNLCFLNHQRSLCSIPHTRLSRMQIVFPSLSLFLSSSCALREARQKYYSQPTVYTCTTSRYRKSILTSTEKSTSALPSRLPRLMSTHMCRRTIVRLSSVFLDATSSIIFFLRRERAWKATRDRIARHRICYWSLVTCKLEIYRCRRKMYSAQQVWMFHYFSPRFYSFLNYIRQRIWCSVIFYYDKMF